MNARRALIIVTALVLALAPPAAPAGPQAAPAAADRPAVAAKPDAAAQAAAAPAAKPAVTKKPAANKVPVKRTEEILPAFQTPKEKTAVIVFYVWLWLSIGVLLYFLRWWVQEADRVFRARFYEPAESPRKDNPMPPLLGE